MIIKTLCNTCMQPFDILVEPTDMSFLKDIIHENDMTCACPRLCGGIISMTGSSIVAQMAKDKRLKSPMSVTAKDLYKAVHGAGLPDEIPTLPTIVESLLKANKVEDLLTEVHNDRVYIHEVKLTDGSILHLTSGIKGAMVLKITKGAPNGP